MIVCGTRIRVNAVLWYRIVDTAKSVIAAAAAQMAENPAALELRRMQMLAEIGAENNSTTVLMIPSDFVALSKSLTEYLRDRTGGKL